MPRFCLSSLVLLLVATCGGCQRPGEGRTTARTDERIRLGAFMSLTGDTADYGISATNGIRLAVEEANAAGGVGGRRVELIVQDTRSDAYETETVVRRLVGEFRVHALLGEVISSRSLVAAGVAEAARVPMLTPSATDPAVTARGDFIFRSCYTDPLQGAALAQFASERLHARRAALLYDPSQSYSVVLAQFIREAFTARGGEVVAIEHYHEGEGEFTEQVARVKAAAPEVVFVPGYYQDAGLIARATAQTGLGAPLVGGDGWDSKGLYETAGPSIVGSFFSSHYAAEDTDPTVQRFVEQYRAIYGSTPDAFAATAYDAARIMLDAIARSASLDGAAIRDALAATRDFPGVTGHITFDERRDARKPIVIIKLGENGKYIVQDRITPELLAPPTPTPAARPVRKRAAPSR